MSARRFLLHYSAEVGKFYHAKHEIYVIGLDKRDAKERFMGLVEKSKALKAMVGDSEILYDLGLVKIEVTKVDDVQ